MEIPLVINDNEYAISTVEGWKTIWEKICCMAYENNNYIENLIVEESQSDLEIYNKKTPKNDEEITLDYYWKQYSRKHGSTMPSVVHELKRLHVPRCLFENLGIYKWFQHSFPDCVITFWGES